MKHLLTIVVIMLVTFSVNAQSVGIGNNSPAASSILDITSTEKGMLIPRMDSVQRNLIAAPAQGLLVYQVKANGGFFYYSGNTWNKVGGGGNEWALNAGNDLYSLKDVAVGTADPAASAAFEVTSIEKGILIPRLTLAQRGLIPTPANSLMVFQIDGNSGFYYYDATNVAWKKVGGDGNEWTKNANGDIFTNRKVGIGNENPVEKLEITGNIKTSGNIIATGEIKPGGSSGQANQVLTATGSGAMFWANVGTANEAINALKIGGNPVVNAAPAKGDLLKWDGAAWAPAVGPSVYSAAGIIGAIPFGGTGAPWMFAGSTTTVTVTEGQTITANFSGVFGHTNAIPQVVSFAVCYSEVAAGSPVYAFYSTNYQDATVAASPNKTVLSTCAAAKVVNGVALPTANFLPPGTYKVGLGIKNQSTTTNLGANDHVNGTVIVY